MAITIYAIIHCGRLSRKEIPIAAKKKRGLFYVPFGSLMEISITDNCKGADGWGVR